MTPTIVSREDWLKARLRLLKSEKALTRMRDMVAEERRRMPWTRVETDYVFDTRDGPRGLADLFAGRSQLLVQHFMLPPGSGHICSGCAITADGVDAARRHFENADLAYIAVSRAPLAEIEAARRRMGWTFDWVSCAGNRFGHDYGVAFTPEQVAAGERLYNYGTSPFLLEDLHGISVFAKDAGGAVFHTYSTYARGAETLVAPFHFLDLVPKGRNEEGIMNWVRLHDEYGPAANDAGSCCAADD